MVDPVAIMTEDPLGNCVRYPIIIQPLIIVLAQVQRISFPRQKNIFISILTFLHRIVQKKLQKILVSFSVVVQKRRRHIASRYFTQYGLI